MLKLPKTPREGTFLADGANWAFIVWEALPGLFLWFYFKIFSHFVKVLQRLQ